MTCAGHVMPRPGLGLKLSTTYSMAFIVCHHLWHTCDVMIHKVTLKLPWLWQSFGASWAELIIIFENPFSPMRHVLSMSSMLYRKEAYFKGVYFHFVQ